MVNITKQVLPITIFLLMIGIAGAASFPAENLNPYYDELADFINVSLDTTTGKLNIGLNTSFYTLNITNNVLVVGNVNVTSNLTITGEIYLRGEILQLEKDAFKIINGTALPFSIFLIVNWTSLYDNEASTRWQKLNDTDNWIVLYNNEGTTRWQLINDTSNFLTLLSVNISNGNLITPNNTTFVTSLLTDANIPNDLTIQTTSDLTIGGGFASGGITLEADGDIWVNGSLFIIGNISNVNVNNININGSLYPTLDALFDLGSNTLRWRNINASGIIESSSLTSPTIRITDLQDLDSSNFFDLTGCGTSATFTAIDSTGAVTCSAISIIESQISDLQAYLLATSSFFNSFFNNENASERWAFHQNAQGYSDANASDVAVGGEVSGTIGNVALSNTALDDQYARLTTELNRVNLTDLILGNSTNITFSYDVTTNKINFSIKGGFFPKTDIDTEAELEALLTDVTDVLTNNDIPAAETDPEVDVVTANEVCRGGPN